MRILRKRIEKGEYNLLRFECRCDECHTKVSVVVNDRIDGDERMITYSCPICRTCYRVYKIED